VLFHGPSFTAPVSRQRENPEEVCSEIDMKNVHFKTSEDRGDGSAGSEEAAKNGDQHDIAFFVACTPS